MSEAAAEAALIDLTDRPAEAAAADAATAVPVPVPGGEHPDRAARPSGAGSSR